MLIQIGVRKERNTKWDDVQPDDRMRHCSDLATAGQLFLNQLSAPACHADRSCPAAPMPSIRRSTDEEPG
ncbi:hypothetical protein [Streptomyces sp. NPDC002573]|uniref:hypothetical protein n=1 Tax=Streptomyces sp. NPDC002573 TaxID=3364651 RepID=UPI0036886B2D